MKIFSKKKDQDKKEKVSKNAVENANTQQQNQKKEIDFKNFKKFPFERFGFDLYWSPSQWVYVIFLNDQTYDFDPILMRELTKKIADLFVEFYVEENLKTVKNDAKTLKKIIFSDY